MKLNFSPSLFKAYPWDSTLQKSECETVAMNIMVILSRTGNTFRTLSWEEYAAERQKDGNFSEGEKKYFDDVAYLMKGEKWLVINFSKTWKDAYIAMLETAIGIDNPE